MLTSIEYINIIVTSMYDYWLLVSINMETVIMILIAIWFSMVIVLSML